MGCINWNREVEVSLKGKTGPGDMPCWHLISNLTLTMVTTTLNKLTQAINILIVSQFDNVIEIDKDRNILFDYS